MVGRLFILIAAVLLAGCGSPSSTTSSAEAPSSAAAPARTEVRQRASSAAISAYPNSIAPGGQVPITATYLTPGERVTLESISPTGIRSALATLTADASGTVRYTWIAGSSLGSWRFNLTDATGIPSPTLYVEVVNDPLRLTVASNNITLGQNADFTITGATRDYRLRLHRELNGYLPDVDLIPDASGRATYSWAPTSAGRWRFFAYNLSGYKTGWLEVNVATVLPSPTPTPTPTPSPQPSPGLGGVLMIATPTAVTVGNTVTLQITGETPGSSLTVYKQAPAGYYYNDYPTVGPNGAVNVTWNTTGFPTGTWTVFSYGTRGYSNRVSVNLSSSGSGFALATSRTSMTAGSSATLTVTGAPPYSYPTLYRVTPLGSTTTTSLYAGSDGRASYTFTTSYYSTRGNYTFYVRNSSGQETNRVTVYVY